MIGSSRVVVIDRERTDVMIAGQVAMFLDIAAAVDPSNPANDYFTVPRTQEEIQEQYAERNMALYMALGFAAQGGYPCGFKLDPAEPSWPVLYIKLPGGLVSWHMPAYADEFDGHTTEVKYARVKQFSDDVQEALSEGPRMGVIPVVPAPASDPTEPIIKAPTDEQGEQGR